MASAPLHGKVAFITGASRGIGQACAIALANAGAHCIISARSQGGLIETDNHIRKTGGHSTILPIDLGKQSEKHQIDQIGPSIATEFHRLDIFIHAAFQYIPLTPISQISDMIWERNITANLTSCHQLIRTLSPILCVTPNAHALFLQGLTTADPFWGNIAITHTAIQTMVECWKKEVKNLSTLSIDCICPHPTDTLLRRSFFPAEDKTSLLSPAQTAEHIIQTILSKDNN